jgi:hypothetical protein
MSGVKSSNLSHESLCLWGLFTSSGELIWRPWGLIFEALPDKLLSRVRDRSQEVRRRRPARLVKSKFKKIVSG